jgi:hypothetical protein
MAYYPVLLGLASLSDQYVAAAGAQKQGFAIAAEALIAQNNAFNPIYESLLAAGILIFALAEGSLSQGRCLFGHSELRGGHHRDGTFPCRRSWLPFVVGRPLRLVRRSRLEAHQTG